MFVSDDSGEGILSVAALAGQVGRSDELGPFRLEFSQREPTGVIVTHADRVGHHRHWLAPRQKPQHRRTKPRLQPGPEHDKLICRKLRQEPVGAWVCKGVIRPLLKDDLLIVPKKISRQIGRFTRPEKQMIR